MIEEKLLYGLSRRQRSIIRFIVDFCQEKGYPPTIRDIGRGVGLSSSSTVHSHLNTLEKKGFIRRDPSRPRAMEVLTQAGLPSCKPAAGDKTVSGKFSTKKIFTKIIECPLVRDFSDAPSGGWFRNEKNVELTVPLPGKLLGSPDAFLYRMINESMIGAGIMEGDLCIFHPADRVNDGEITLLASNSQMTVKRVFRHMNLYRLEPENRRMNSVFVRDLLVLGRLTGVIRSDFQF